MGGLLADKQTAAPYLYPNLSQCTTGPLAGEGLADDNAINVQSLTKR